MTRSDPSYRRCSPRCVCACVRACVRACHFILSVCLFICFYGVAFSAKVYFYKCFSKENVFYFVKTICDLSVHCLKLLITIKHLNLL